MSSLPYPHQVRDADPALQERVIRHLSPGMMDGAIQVGEDRYLYPKMPVDRLAAIYNYPLDPRDTWVVTMPKCGTTWTQEMVWLIANDCDFAGAQTPLVPGRWNFLEMTYHSLISDRGMRGIMWEALTTKLWRSPWSLWTMVKMMRPRSYNPPRFIKTHMPFSMLPPRLLDTCKVVYVARNPKDALVSYYHHHKLMRVQGFTGTFEDFFNLFLEDSLLQLPFMPHVREAWDKRDSAHMLFLFFEEMKADLRGVIKRVAEFLGKTLTEEQVEQLYEHLKFDNFKKNQYVNMDPMKEFGVLAADKSFVRKGKTGDWKNHFTDEMDARMDAWMAEKLRGTDLSFQTTLKQQD